MSRNPRILTAADKEYASELLKERIYATLALIAVLISIDAEHTSPFKAAFLVVGTIVSLWAASIVATLMSRRVIYHDSLDPHPEREHHVRKHAPMLAALVFPVFMIALSAIKILSLNAAVVISIASAVLLLVVWSVLSARSMKATKFPTLVLVITEVMIGLAVVGLKLLTAH